MTREEREKEIYKRFRDDTERQSVYSSVRKYLIEQMRKTSGELYLYYLGGAVTWDRHRNS